MVWGQLQAERAEVCQALLDEVKPMSEDITALQDTEPSDENTREVEWRHRESLQGRLHQIDDALDKLLSGRYEKCADCGRPIDEKRLNADAAVTLCLECRRSLEGIRAFSTL